MLGHSILHGGPGLRGLSTAVKCYLSSDRNTAEMQSLPLSLKDVPDLEVRRMIVEVNCNVLQIQCWVLVISPLDRNRDWVEGRAVAQVMVG